jgi:hypothetical protein
MRSLFLQLVKQLQGWFLMAAILVGILALSHNSPSPQALLGVYDPDHAFTQTSIIDLEHHFVPWRPDNANELSQALEPSNTSAFP